MTPVFAFIFLRRERYLYFGKDEPSVAVFWLKTLLDPYLNGLFKGSF